MKRRERCELKTRTAQRESIFSSSYIKAEYMCTIDFLMEMKYFVDSTAYELYVLRGFNILFKVHIFFEDLSRLYRERLVFCR